MQSPRSASRGVRIHVEWSVHPKRPTAPSLPRTGRQLVGERFRALPLEQRSQATSLDLPEQSRRLHVHAAQMLTSVGPMPAERQHAPRPYANSTA